MNHIYISMDDLRELVGQMKAGIGTIGDTTVDTVYAEPIAILTDLWNYAHELGHSDERACAEAERNSEPCGYTFAEVVKARNRMCRATNCEECRRCPLFDMKGCEISGLSTDAYIAEFENIVMTWAKEHPEMRYPTFNEWRDENFPGSLRVFTLCDFEPNVKCPKGGNCEECADMEIPERIAAKLGIQKKVIK